MVYFLTIESLRGLALYLSMAKEAIWTIVVQFQFSL